MMTKKRATIKQVAREAGVSTQTVSRVINDRPDVAPGTREHVQQVISRLGYQPSAIARSLIRQRSHTLGLVIGGLDYYGPSRTLVGIEQQANELGYSLHLSLLHQPDTDQVETVLTSLLYRQVDGIIWAVSEIGTNRAWLLRKIPHLPVPIILLTMEPRPGLFVVTVDNRMGGRLATEHLLAQGYRRIGLITGPLNWWEARQRRLGWQEALLDQGFTPDESRCVEGNWTAASGEAGLHRLLEQEPRLDALFVSNDQMALGALTAIHQMGRRVPEDLALVGYDNIPEAAYFWPPLTTIRQKLIQLGRTVVNELSQRIEARQRGEETPSPRTIWLQPELVVRASSPQVSIQDKP